MGLLTIFLKHALFLIVTTVTLYLPCHAGQQQDSAISIFVGSGYTPLHYRMSLWNIDIGFDRNETALTIGKRFWKGNFYSGIGTDLFSLGFAYYGLLGYQWSFLKFFALNIETYTLGSFYWERVSGHVYAGMSIIW